MQSSNVRYFKHGLIYLGVLFGVFSLCFSIALADSDIDAAGDYEALEIKLIQPFESKHFGSLTLPAFWDVSEDDSQAVLQAVEHAHPQKLSIHLFLIEKLPPLGSARLMKNIAIVLQNSLIDGTIVEERAVKANKEITIDHHYIHTQGWEGEIERSCISLVFLQKGKLLSLNLCGPSSRDFISAGGAVLNDIFTNMR